MMEREIFSEAETKNLLRTRAAQIEEYLKECRSFLWDIPQRLEDAMLYSLEAGGKRLRPVLCMSCASLCGIQPATAFPFCAAIEMIHTYSLIHDDLPAMDNDDFRRGRPSSHKAFDEATAILAGDGLLTDAFFVACKTDVAPRALLAAIAELARAAGSSGMVGGQELDMLYAGQKEVDKAEASRMQSMKTGAMLRASCLCGALLAGASASLMEKLSRYGAALGRAFQIADDILDVIGDPAIMGKPAGSDAAAGKCAWPALVGLDESRKMAAEEAEKAISALDGLEGEEAAFLRGLALYTVRRVN